MCVGGRPHPRRHLHALIDEQLLVWMTTAAESASKHSTTGGVAQVLLLGLLLGLQQDPLSAEPGPVCEAAALGGRQMAAGRTVDLQGQNCLFKGRAVQLF